MESIVTAFTTAVGAIKTDALSMIAVAVPSALAIMGIFIATRLGVKFFKSFSK